MQGKKVSFSSFQMKRFDMFIVFSIALFLCLLTVQADHPRWPSGQPKRHCDFTEPCGWAIYNSFTGIVDSFTSSVSCDCPPDKKCFKTEDMKQNAYIIYRCMPDGLYE